MKNMLSRAILALVLAAGIAPTFAAAPPPVPALPDTERRTSYSITASTCQCAVNMALYGDSTDYQSWVEVFINGVQVNYNDPLLGWAITSPSGPLANLPRPITDAVLTFANAQTGVIQIVGARRPRRVQQFQENTGVSARNLNQVITDIVAMLREAWDKINDVTGRGVFAPPGETMATLPPVANRAGMGAGFDSNGNLVPTVGGPSGSFAAGSGVTFTGANPTTISTQTFSPGVGIAFTGNNPTVISAPTGANPVIASRALAQTLNLSAFGSVSTLGYAASGDGGGANFRKVTTQFTDTFPIAATITTAGSSCANGTYFGVHLVNVSGTNLGHGAMAQIVVAGGVVTSFTLTTPGNQYSVGDVYTNDTTFTCSGSSPTFTITAVNFVASFIDAVGTKFQYVVGPSGTPNVRQFGAAMNFNRALPDSSSTNDQPSFQAALNFCTFGNAFPDNGGALGCRVVVGPGASLICGGLIVWDRIVLDLAGATIKQCDADASTQHFITLGDPLNHFSSFFNGIRNGILFGGTGAASGNAAMVYSNSAQQGDAVADLAVYSVNRGCVFTDTGWGGTSYFHIKNLYCVPNGSTAGFGVHLGYPQALQVIDGGTQFSAGVLMTQPYIILTTGAVNVIRDTYFEQSAAGIANEVPTSNPVGTQNHIDNLGGSASVTNLISNVPGFATGITKVGSVAGNGSACTVFSGGTCVKTGNVVLDTLY